MSESSTTPTVSPEQELLDLLQDSAIDYCARALPHKRLRTLQATARSFDRALWTEMAGLGWAGLLVPEARGGAGLGAAAAATLARQLGRVAAPEPLLETAIASATLLAELDDDDSRLQALIEGTLVCTCPLDSRAWQGEALTAREDGAAYVLDGTLDHLALAPDVDMFLLPVHCAGQRAVFALPATQPGLVITPCTLADGSRAGTVTLSGARCALSARLGNGTTPAALETVVGHALALSGLAAGAYLLGLCDALLDMTLDYLRTRKQFGRAIGTFQALQHRLGDLYLHIRLTAAALTVAIDACDSHADVAAKLVASARLRARAGETALSAAREAIQLHGAIGYTEQCDVSLFVQRILVMQARFGGALAELRAVPGFAFGEGSTSTIDVTTHIVRTIDSAPDGDWNAVPDDVFRMTVRQWIEANYPSELRHVPGQLRWAEIRDWHQRLVARGWAAPAWPREHDGMGLGPSKMLIFIEELERWGVARAPDQGIVMLGPILFEYGNAAQRARFLPGALTGEQIWCQGYSEPNAGSDLASLSTSAVLVGDEFIVNGQKTWTTHGLDATHMYCLVRTDNQVKPQAGISFLIIDLDQPGVTVRPIVNLGGHVDFCEVFLDDVRVPRANLVGEINQGWTIAKSLLGHERLFVGSPKLCQHALHQLRELGAATGRADDPVFVDMLTRYTLDVLDLEALYAEYAAIIRAGGALGADVAILKIWSTETYVRLSETILREAGAAAAVRGRSAYGAAAIDVLSHYYNARPAPIYAGSNEIQRNIIAKAVLGLPT